MIARIARKELLDLIRDGRFRLLGGLVLASAVLSLWVGWRQFEDVRRQHVLAQQATRQQWLSQAPKNPHSAAHYGMYAFKPRNPLSLFDTGVDAYVGVATWLEAHRQDEFKYRPAQDRTSAERFGELTAAFTLLVLVPLFIVLVSFGSFTGEREPGTLRALLGLGLNVRTLSLGKALGASGALALVLVPAASMAILGLLLAGSDGSATADLPRGAWLALCYLVYFAVFLAVSFGVSMRARSSRAALVILLSFWAFNALVSARMARDLAATLHPVPSAVEFQRALQAELADQHDLQAHLQRRQQELLGQYGVESLAALPLNFRGIRLQEGETMGMRCLTATTAVCSTPMPARTPWLAASACWRRSCPCARSPWR